MLSTHQGKSDVMCFGTYRVVSHLHPTRWPLGEKLHIQQGVHKAPCFAVLIDTSVVSSGAYLLSPSVPVLLVRIGVGLVLADGGPHR